MTITARYPGICTRCQRPITIGQQIEWSKGSRPYHTACHEASGTAARELADAREPLAGARGGVRHATARTNRRAAECDHCGAWLRAGEGRLEYCIEDSGCLKHHDESGWHVYCLDTDGCKQRRTAARAAAKATIAARKARAAERRALEAAFLAGEQLAEEAITDAVANGERIVIDPGVHGSGCVWVVVQPTDLIWLCGGYYDDYRASAWRLPRTAEIEARVRAFASA